jgi:hypothetical protein
MGHEIHDAGVSKQLKDLVTVHNENDFAMQLRR